MTRAANADTCRSLPLQVNVDSNALKGKAEKENMHSVSWDCANRDVIQHTR